VQLDTAVSQVSSLHIRQPSHCAGLWLDALVYEMYGFIHSSSLGLVVSKPPAGRCSTAQRAARTTGSSKLPRDGRVLLCALPAEGTATAAAASPPRRQQGLIQHKREAFWFYRFLSIVYDTIVNPFHWTVDMRNASLSQAGLDDAGGQADFRVLDVGGGTGFCTEGIVEYIAPSQVTLLDQSPHQMEVAKRKPTLRGVTFVQGDAEALPFPTDSFDRVVSAGSIEYWPEPQRGIAEAYRVLKPGGMATIIGPVRATNPVSRFFCDLWMLFPMEEEYREWFTRAGFTDLKVSYIGPPAYKGVRQHGLIMGLTITGRKPAPGEAKIQLGPMKERLDQTKPMTLTERLLFLGRWLLGCIAGFYYFLLPFAIMIYAAIFIREPRKSKDVAA
jgi:MPBQ/MSBQ methyltransferase